MRVSPPELARAFAGPYASISTTRCRRLARDRKSTRLNSSHLVISYAVFCLKKKKNDSAVIIRVIHTIAAEHFHDTYFPLSRGIILFHNLYMMIHVVNDLFNRVMRYRTMVM